MKLLRVNPGLAIDVDKIVMLDIRQIAGTYMLMVTLATGGEVVISQHTNREAMKLELTDLVEKAGRWT